MAGNFKAGNSLNLAVTAVVGQHSRVTMHCFPPDVIDFAMLPTQRFWRESVSCDLEVTKESARCWEKFPAI